MRKNAEDTSVIKRGKIMEQLDIKSLYEEELKEKMISLNENAREIIFFSSHFSCIVVWKRNLLLKQAS